MPSCSANDSQNVDARPPTAGGGTTAAAADLVTDAKAPAPAGNDCWRERCKNEEIGGTPCPPGICQRDHAGHPSHWHARPKCPDHDRPFGLAAKDAAPQPEPTARQTAVAERLLPTVNAYVEALRGLEAAGALGDYDRAHLDGLSAWLEKLQRELATPGK